MIIVKSISSKNKSYKELIYRTSDNKVLNESKRGKPNESTNF